VLRSSEEQECTRLWCLGRVESQNANEPTSFTTNTRPSYAAWRKSCTCVEKTPMQTGTRYPFGRLVWLGYPGGSVHQISNSRFTIRPDVVPVAQYRPKNGSQFHWTDPKSRAHDTAESFCRPPQITVLCQRIWIQVLGYASSQDQEAGALKQAMDAFL
jgi:hypothetical protein